MAGTRNHGVSLPPSPGCFHFLSQKTKTGKCLLLLVMAFCCSFWFFVKCFHLSIALVVVAFCRYEKPKRATKGKKCPNANQALAININIMNEFRHFCFLFGPVNNKSLYSSFSRLKSLHIGITISPHLS